MYVITINTDTCQGCGDCVGACPAEMFELQDGKAVLVGETLSRAVEAATGWTGFSADDAMAVGRRISNLLRVYNLRCGLAPELERPSKRYGSIPVDGPMAGKSILEHWDDMRRGYYELMGWDFETGRPLPETLKRYGLEELIPDVWPQGAGR